MTITAEDRKFIDEMMARIRKIGEQQHQTAIQTANKLADGELVTDGELVDALMTLVAKLTFPNPLIAIGYEIAGRLMDYGEIAVTPGGYERDWFHEKD